MLNLFRFCRKNFNFILLGLVIVLAWLLLLALIGLIYCVMRSRRLSRLLDDYTTNLDKNKTKTRKKAGQAIPMKSEKYGNVESPIHSIVTPSGSIASQNETHEYEVIRTIGVDSPEGRGSAKSHTKLFVKRHKQPKVALYETFPFDSKPQPPPVKKIRVKREKQKVATPRTPDSVAAPKDYTAISLSKDERLHSAKKSSQRLKKITPQTKTSLMSPANKRSNEKHKDPMLKMSFEYKSPNEEEKQIKMSESMTSRKKNANQPRPAPAVKQNSVREKQEGSTQ